MSDIKIPRPEYPRPDFEREEWINLNGEWEFAFDDDNVGEAEGWYKGKKFDKKIIVPFCYQSKLSGINDKSTHLVLWYRKEVILPQTFKGKRILLNFGAVDYYAKVWVNGQLACTHKGGNVPFKADITRYLIEGANEITVKATDTYECVQPRGKQDWKEKPDRIRYYNTSGIWQTVWLETVLDVYIDRIRFTPDVDNKTVLTEIHLEQFPCEMELNLEVSLNDRIVRRILVGIKDRITKITIDLPEEDPVLDVFQCWSPNKPVLYDVKIDLLRDGNLMDRVKSYFGFRKVSAIDDRIYLNNMPLYQKLVLDQGYWEESLMTPPSDEAIIKDIELIKQMGFNGARKHQKIEDPRYYYWADRMGLLVWGEMPSAYRFNTEEVENITDEWIEFINRDYNHPCIITWVPLNESWGVKNIFVNKNQQGFAKALYFITKALDDTRLVSTNDGWDHVTTDICAIHEYMKNGQEFIERFMDKDKVVSGEISKKRLFCEGEKYQGQPVLITEYGGVAFVNELGDTWGYHKPVTDAQEFLKKFEDMTMAIKKIPYIRGYCYTQLTDTFQEANGLLTMDRSFKADPNEIKKINNR